LGNGGNTSGLISLVEVVTSTDIIDGYIGTAAIVN